jgi:PPOX class probable F420-dependent enzyme
MIALGLARQEELSAVLQVNSTTLYRQQRRLRAHGVLGVVDGKRGPRGPHRFTGDKRDRVAELLEAGQSIRHAAAQVGVTEGTIRHALRRGARSGVRSIGTARTMERKMTRPHPSATARIATKEKTMALALSDEIKRLIDGPNFAHLASLMPDGSPQSAPVWVSREGDRILIGTSESSLKARNTRRDPRVSLSIVDVENPYVEAQLRGRVVERRPDPNLAVKDVTARKYTGRPFPWRSPEGSVTLVIEVEKAKFAHLPFTHAPS